MFKNNKNDETIKHLEWQIDSLKSQLQSTKEQHQDSIQLLRQQVSKIAQGQNVSPISIERGTPYDSIDSQDLDAFRENNPEALILDVRTDEEWDLGHIAGAMHIDVNSLEQRLSQLNDPKQTIIAICARGGRSAAACEVLYRNHFKHLINVEGGMMAYPGQTSDAQIKPLSIEGLEGESHLLKKVADFLDHKVRPALKRDGGDIEFHGISKNIVKVSMVGACGGCGVRDTTVNEGIKSALIEAIPEIEGIEDVG